MACSASTIWPERAKAPAYRDCAAMSPGSASAAAPYIERAMSCCPDASATSATCRREALSGVRVTFTECELHPASTRSVAPPNTPRTMGAHLRASEYGTGLIEVPPGRTRLLPRGRATADRETVAV